MPPTDAHPMVGRSGRKGSPPWSRCYSSRTTTLWATVLADEGYSVVTAADGIEALEVVQRAVHTRTASLPSRANRVSIDGERLGERIREKLVASRLPREAPTKTWVGELVRRSRWRPPA